MAKRQDDQYEDALGSIYDFIFKNNWEPGRGMRPVRPSGVSGPDEMARALSEIAANPYTYVPDAMLGHVNNNFLGSNFVEIELEPDGEKIKIGPSNIVSALKDPNKFVDKVFEDQKEENKWKRYATGASYLDHGIATAIGLASGMKMGEAWNFGAAARNGYGELDGNTRNGIRASHQEITASNAAIEASIDLAKAQAQSENLNPNSQEFGNRVYELAKSNKAQMKKDQEILKKAMNKNAKLGGLGFLGGNRPSPTNAAAMTAYQNDLNQMMSGVRSNLMQEIGDQARVDALMARLGKEVERNENYRGGVTGYRMMYARNQRLKGQLAETQEEMGQHIMAANLAYTWERTHGPGDDYRKIRGWGNVRDEFESAKKDALDKINDPNVSQAEKDAFQEYVNEMEAAKERVDNIGANINASYNKSKEYFRAPVWGANQKPKADVKANRELTTEMMGAERAKLNIQLRLAPDEFERRRIMAQMVGLERGMDKVKYRSSLPNYQGTVASWTGSYRAMQGLMAGSYLSHVIDGRAWYKGYKGVPGKNANSVYQRRGKDENGNTIYIGEHMGDKAIKKGNYATNIVLPRDNINQHYARLTSMYYFTPGSLLKTATFNGEGFSYIAEMRQRALQRSFFEDRGDHMKSFLEANTGLFAGIEFNGEKLIGSDGTMNNAVLAANYLQVMDILGQNENLLSPGLADILKRANKKYASVARFGGMGKWMQTNIADRMNWQNYAKRFVKWGPVGKFMTKIPAGQTLGKVLGGEMALRTAIKGGVHSAAAALGVATGGVGAIVVEAIAWVGTEIAYRLAKPLLKISLVALVGFCGMIGFLLYYLSDSAFNVGGNDVAYATMPPDTQVYCGGEIYTGPNIDPYTQRPVFAPGTIVPGTGPVGPGGPGGSSYPPGSTPPPGTQIPAATGNIPSDAQCPLSSGFRCTQGPDGHWSHAAMESQAIDGYSQTWTAPTDGVVTFANSSNDCEWDKGNDRGGEIWFTDSEGNEYRIMHVSPNVQAGPVSKGTVVGTIQTNLPVSDCWSGGHLHMDTKTNGQWTNSLDVYRQLGCNISSCPR